MPRYQRATKPTNKTESMKPKSTTQTTKTIKNPNEVILRVRGKDGTFRYSMKPTETIIHLKQKLQQDTGVDSSIIRLSTKPNPKDHEYLQRESYTLQQYGIKTGDMLFMSYPGTVKSKQDVEEEKKKEELKKLIGDGTDIDNLGLKYIKKQWTAAEYMQYVEKFLPRIKHQGYSICSSVEVDGLAATQFQQFLREMGLKVQRMGYMYGSVSPGHPPDLSEEDKKKDQKIAEEIKKEKFEDVTVQVIYEPPQQGSETSFVELKDNLEERVETLAGLLGMKRVGWIFSHEGGRTDYPLSGAEVVKAAELQSKYGPSFVTVTVSPNEEGQLQFEAFQVSKQAVELYEKGNLLADSKNPKIVKTKKKVEVERKITNEIDVNLLITTVAIKNYSGLFLVGFPPRNRPSADYKQSMSKLKQILHARRNMKFVKRITDFHLLLFLTDYLSLSSDMPTLCEAVRTQNQNMAVGFEHLIEAYSESL